MSRRSRGKTRLELRKVCGIALICVSIVVLATLPGIPGPVVAAITALLVGLILLM